MKLVGFFSGLMELDTSTRDYMIISRGVYEQSKQGALLSQDEKGELIG